jgi:hypothetical protein
MKRLFICLIIIGLLTSCAKPEISPAPHNDLELRVVSSLEANSTKIENLLIELSETEKAVKPIDRKTLGQLNYEVNVKWTGPLEPVVKKVATSVGMKFNVIGSPNTPVLVSIDARDKMVLDVLRNLGMQAGNLAKITYRPRENAVEILYPNN